MANEFNIYRDWLGLTGVASAPTHYELLGLDDFTSDVALIQSAHAAVMRRLATVRPVDNGADGRLALWEKLSSDANLALATLCDPASRAAYDHWLQANTGKSPVPAGATPTVESPRADLYPPGMGPATNAGPAYAATPAAPAYNPVGGAPMAAAPNMAYPPASPMAPAGYPPATPYVNVQQPQVGYPGANYPPGYSGAPQGGYGVPAAMPAGYAAVPGAYQQPMAYPQPAAMGPMAPMGAYGVPAAGMQPYGAPAYGNAMPMANPMAPAAAPMGYGAAPMATQPGTLQAGYAAPAAPAPAGEAPLKMRTAGASAAKHRRERDAQGGLMIWGTVAVLVLLGMAGVAYKVLGPGKTDEVQVAQAPVTAPPVMAVPAQGTPVTKPQTSTNTQPSPNGGKPVEGLATGPGMAGTRPTKPGKEKGKEGEPVANVVKPKPTEEGTKPEMEKEPSEEMTPEKPEEEMPAEGDPKTKPEKPEEPATPPKTEEMPVKLPERSTVEDLERHLVKAKQALSEHNQDVFNRAIEQAEGKAVLPEHRAMVSRLKLLAMLAGEYRQAIVKSFEAMDGGENFKVGSSTQVAFVEFTGKKAIVRVAGANREYPLADLPPGLGVAVAHFTLKSDDPSTLLMEGAYLFAHRKASDEEIERATELWNLADAGGSSAMELMPILKDKYELLKDFDALVAKQAAQPAN
ncbi:MAG: hypothetical protein U0894_06135 [Pirellulales bacterium]